MKRLLQRLASGKVNRSCRARVLEYPPIPVLCRATWLLHRQWASCSHIREAAATSELTTSQTTHSVLSHQVFDVCSSPFWHSLSEIAMNLDLPDVQSFPGLSSSAARWPWEPSTLGTSHPILYHLTCYAPVHTASYMLVQAGHLS